MAEQLDFQTQLRPRSNPDREKASHVRLGIRSFRMHRKDTSLVNDLRSCFGRIVGSSSLGRIVGSIPRGDERNVLSKHHNQEPKRAKSGKERSETFKI